MKIGELAREAGIGISTVRYYEAQGLLPKPPTRDSGYRDYQASDLERLKLIVAAKRHRFPLRTIQLVLSALDQEPEPCSEIARLVEERIESVGREIADLEALRSQLRTQIEAWKKGALPDADCLCVILQTRALHPSKENKTMSQSTIEVFTGGCQLCRDAIEVVTEAVRPCGCAVVERSIDGPEAKAYGLKSVPSVVRDGELVFAGLPTLEEAIAKLRK